MLFALIARIEGFVFMVMVVQVTCEEHAVITDLIKALCQGLYQFPDLLAQLGRLRLLSGLILLAQQAQLCSDIADLMQLITAIRI